MTNIVASRAHAPSVLPEEEDEVFTLDPSVRARKRESRWVITSRILLVD